MKHRRPSMALPLAISSAVSLSLLSSTAAGQVAEPKQIDTVTVKCLVDNATWLQTLPDDPVEFFGDLCPKAVDHESIDNSVRTDTPDVTMKPDATAEPPLRLAIRKDGLKCLAQFSSLISVPIVDLFWDRGVVVGIAFGQTKLDFENCTTSSETAKSKGSP